MADQHHHHYYVSVSDIEIYRNDILAAMPSYSWPPVDVPTATMIDPRNYHSNNYYYYLPVSDIEINRNDILVAVPPYSRPPVDVAMATMIDPRNYVSNNNYYYRREREEEGNSKTADGVVGRNYLAGTEGVAVGLRATPSDEEQCSICLEDMKDPEVDLVRLPCKHKFHDKCIVSWVECCFQTAAACSTCPVCRFRIGIDFPPDSDSASASAAHSCLAS